VKRAAARPKALLVHQACRSTPAMQRATGNSMVTTAPTRA